MPSVTLCSERVGHRPRSGPILVRSLEVDGVDQLDQVGVVSRLTHLGWWGIPASLQRAWHR